MPDIVPSKWHFGKLAENIKVNVSLRLVNKKSGFIIDITSILN